MKFLLTMNQIAYFKPETTARRLKNDYHHGSGNPVHFLGYLRLIRLLPRLASRAKEFQPELYRKEVREIFLDTPWEHSENPWFALFLPEFRTFFSPEEWRQLKRRSQKMHPFLNNHLIKALEHAYSQLLLEQFLHITTFLTKNWRIHSTKLRC